MSNLRVIRGEGHGLLVQASKVPFGGDAPADATAPPGDSAQAGWGFDALREAAGELWRKVGAPARAGRRAAPDAAEAAVLAALARGDRRAALTLLMQTQGDVVYEFCLRIVKDTALAEDVRQRVFLQAYEGLPGFAGGSSLRTWLLGIARFRALDALRSARGQAARVTLDEEGLSAVAHEAADPCERAGLSRTAVALIECLESCVSRDEQRLIVLHVCEGVSYEELAARFGQKADTLRACVARALPKLRRGLKRRGIEP